jgi:hypothetical protein
MEPSNHVTSETQARYAHLHALIEIRLAELIDALERHEADRNNWHRSHDLTIVDRTLSEALASLDA